MDKYQKDFVCWAKVAEEIEKQERSNVKCGVISWIYTGVNIGSEVDGKGNSFTRPGLIINLYGDRLALVAFISSRPKTGRFYRRIMVNGQPRVVIINQFRVVDLKRIGDYIDEISDIQLDSIRRSIARVVMECQSR